MNFGALDLHGSLSLELGRRLYELLWWALVVFGANVSIRTIIACVGKVDLEVKRNSDTAEGK